MIRVPFIGETVYWLSETGQLISGQLVSFDRFQAFVAYGEGPFGQKLLRFIERKKLFEQASEVRL